MWLPGLIALLGGKSNGDVAAVPPELEPQPVAPAESAAPEPAPGPPSETGDPYVSLAFAAGWQMTEMYQCALRIKSGADTPVVAPPEGSGLPCLRALAATERARLALTEIEVALYKLRGHFAAADRGAPGLARIGPALERSQ